MKIKIFPLVPMVLLIGLALPHLPKGNDSIRQLAALNKGHSLSIPPGRLLAGPKYRPIDPPTNLMVNPLIKPKRDGAYCMQLIMPSQPKIPKVA